VAKREQNERRFPNWLDLPDGGRRYWYDVPGYHRGFARYIKVVDMNELTVQLVQEIYNDAGQLIESHEKYPVDTGHTRIGETDKGEAE